MGPTIPFRARPVSGCHDGRADGMRAEFTRAAGLASAGKPLRTAPYLGFPRPGMVIGDQVATDGILARRLGYAFVLVDPELTGVPLGPRLMGAGGRLVRPLLFARTRPESHSN